VDHQVVIASSGPLITLRDEVVVLAGSVIRSVGGSTRPAFEVQIGPHALVSTLCSIVGSTVGRNAYVATGVIILQGAYVGEGARIGAGAIVHTNTRLPANARVGMRHVAVADGDGFISTGDIEVARRAIGRLDFFEHAFGVDEPEQTLLHDRVIDPLLAEVHGWDDA
jgi:serine acetyltransferase